MLDGLRTAPTADNPFPGAPLFGANNGLYVQDLFVSYNLENVLLKLGQWETLLGYEVIDSVANRNVTQGLLFTYAIPLVHTGLQASGKIGGSDSAFGWAAAYVNGWNNPIDTNDNKGVLGQLNFSGGRLHDRAQRLLRCRPEHRLHRPDHRRRTARTRRSCWTGRRRSTANDLLTFWANADWGMQKDVHFVAGPNAGNTKDAVWYGLALGTQFTFTEKTSFAVRGEWLRDTEGYRIVAGNNTSAYSLTGTLAYKLTPNLLTRAGGPLRRAHEPRGDATTRSSRRATSTGASSNDFQGLVQVAYIFD